MRARVSLLLAYLLVIVFSLLPFATPAAQAKQANFSGWFYGHDAQEFGGDSGIILISGGNCKPNDYNIGYPDFACETYTAYYFNNGSQYDFTGGYPTQTTYHVDGSDPSTATGHGGWDDGKVVTNIQNTAFFNQSFPGSNQPPPPGPEDPSTMQITVNLQFIIKDGVVAKGQQVGPVDVYLKSADGKTTIQVTQSDNSTDTSEGSNHIDLIDRFSNVAAGDYQICVPAMDTSPKPNCQAVHKTKGAISVITFEGYATADALRSSSSTSQSEAEIQCDQNSGNFAWIICPAAQTLTSFLDFLFKKIILPELKLSPLTDTGANQQLHNVWSALKNLANVFFVLIFLLIIFANTLSLDIDNYTIKKLLPRLAAAAIFVQFSYFFCAVVVDLGNVLGDGLSGLVDGVLKGTPPPGVVPTTTTQNLVSNFAIFGLIAGGVVAFALLAGPVLVALLIGFLLAVVAFILTLLFRHILIAVLIVMSPIALAAWVLPNTEKLFRLWYTNLIKSIMMYPIIILILAGGRIIAALGGDPNLGPLGQAVAFIAPIIAFFLIPASFKWAGTAMGSIAGSVRGGAVGAKSGATKRLRASDWAAEQKLKSASRRQRVVGAIPQFGQNQNLPVVGGAIRRLGKVPKSAAGFALATPTSDVGRQRTLNQTVGKFKERLDTLNVNGSELEAVINDIKRPREERLAALQRKAETGGLAVGDKARMAALAPKGMGDMYERAAMSGSAFSKTKETTPQEAYTHINKDGTTSFDKAGFDKAMSPSALPRIKPEALQDLIGEGHIPVAMADTALATQGIAGQMSGRTEELLEQLVRQGERRRNYERRSSAREQYDDADNDSTLAV